MSFDNNVIPLLKASNFLIMSKLILRESLTYKEQTVNGEWDVVCIVGLPWHLNISPFIDTCTNF